MSVGRNLLQPRDGARGVFGDSYSPDGVDMSAAFLVSFRGPNGDCPDTVFTVDSPWSECCADFAAMVKQQIVSDRGGLWKDHQVTIRSIRYLGPWAVWSGERAKYNYDGRRDRVGVDGEQS